MTPKQVYEDQLRLQKLSDQNNLREQKNERDEKSEALETRRENKDEFVEGEIKEKCSVKEVKTEKRKKLLCKNK